MSLTTTVTPAMVAVALGVAAPEPSSVQAEQWQMWIDDVLMLVGVRADSITPAPTVDQARLNYVVRQAVVARAERPKGGATQESVTVDDATKSATYPRSRRVDVEITDEWWALLGLSSAGGGVYAVDTVGSVSAHLPWCSLAFGALYCSCGADIAGTPIYEGGGEFW